MHHLMTKGASGCNSERHAAPRAPSNMRPLTRAGQTARRLDEAMEAESLRRTEEARALRRRAAAS
jgi:hypothetical protein